MCKSSVGRIGTTFKRFDELCCCEGRVIGAVECPFIGACSLYFKKSLSPCLDKADQHWARHACDELCIPEAHSRNRNAVQSVQRSVLAAMRLIRECDGP